VNSENCEFEGQKIICLGYEGMCDAGCGMCAVPVDGLHKEDMTHEQLLKIQSLLKRRIPTGILLIPVISNASDCMCK